MIIVIVIYYNCSIIKLIIKLNLIFLALFLQSLGLLIGTVSARLKNRFFFLADSPQKVDKIHQAKFFAYSCHHHFAD